MQRRLTRIASAILLASVNGGAAHAGLFAVDPGLAGGTPYPAANGTGGYAAWYQDTHGRTLDLCLSKATSSRVLTAPGAPTYMCVLNPAPGVFDDALPLAFPNNWPDETFWFAADAAITDAATGIDLGYGAAIEAAFSGDVADGEQMSFARIRIRVDVPAAGIYTVTHPYGVEVYDVTPEIFADTAGRRAINMTRDIGIGAPKTYDGALKGDVGPFLRSMNGPYTETNPETHAVETFIGDPNINEQVTGSPFNTNYVRIQGPNGIDVRTDLFAVSGKLNVTLPRPTPALVQRATYSRASTTSGVVAQQDVFTQAPPPPGTATFTDSAGAAVAMTEADKTGNWYGQSGVNPVLPVQLLVTADNHLDIPTNSPITTSVPLVDLVSISKAEYSLSSGQITVIASTSDEIGNPRLSAMYTGTETKIADLEGTGAEQSKVTGISPIPPATVTVKSANGGSDTEEVVIVQ